jgi:predicted glycosyltransferase involved in capsule biosynthesis
MKHRLSLIVPYRERDEHLELFIPHMKKFLIDSEIDFHIFVIEQGDNLPFNRAKLLNIGFSETKINFDYFCFHDVDMLPVNSDYTYSEIPTHLASEVQQFNWGLAYDTYFGGVTLFNKKDLETINGYSNNYWGWGAEDDDLWNRCIMKGISPTRRNGRYYSLDHGRDFNDELWRRNYAYLNLQKDVSIRERVVETDGLSSLKYRFISKTDITDCATKIIVSLNDNEEENI